MKLLKFGSFLILLFITISAFAQTAPCETAEAKAFDFWLGDWNINQKILKADGSMLI